MKKSHHGEICRPLRRRQRSQDAPKLAARSSRPEWQLRLYVAGQTARSASALANLKKMCETHLAGRYEIEVIDLLVNPKLAAGDQILAVPTLVRLLPEPMKKIIGTCPTWSACWSVSTCNRSSERPAPMTAASRSTLPTEAVRQRQRLALGACDRQRAAHLRGASAGPLSTWTWSTSRLHPERARAEQLIAVPTLIKLQPLPVRRFIGDMSRTEAIVSGWNCSSSRQPGRNEPCLALIACQGTHRLRPRPGTWPSCRRRTPSLTARLARCRGDAATRCATARSTPSSSATTSTRSKAPRRHPTASAAMCWRRCRMRSLRSMRTTMSSTSIRRPSASTGARHRRRSVCRAASCTRWNGSSPTTKPKRSTA